MYTASVSAVGLPNALNQRLKISSMASLENVCDSAVFMNVGRILERGSVEQLLSSRTLAELYFGT